MGAMVKAHKSKFREEFPLERRKAEAARMSEKYPDRIPVIVEKAAGGDLPDIDKKKYLVPTDLTVGQFVHVIRKRIKLAPEKPSSSSSTTCCRRPPASCRRSTRSRRTRTASCTSHTTASPSLAPELWYTGDRRIIAAFTARNLRRHCDKICSNTAPRPYRTPRIVR